MTTNDPSRSWLLTANLASPIVINSPTPLDSLVAGVLTRGETVDEIDLSPFFDTMDFGGLSVPMCSLPFLGLDEEGREHFEAESHPMQPSALNAVFRNPALHERFDPNEGAMKKGAINYSSEVVTRGTVQRRIETRSVSWWMTGDADAVATLIENEGSIGVQRGKGFGRLSRAGVLIQEVEGSAIGILNPKGELVRPVPFGAAA